MRRFYVSPENVSGNTAFTVCREYHHIVDVLRYRKGDTIKLFDGCGTEYTGRITNIDTLRRSVEVEISGTDIKKPRRRLVLVQSLIRTARMDIAVEAGAELGVTDIYPLSAENSVVKISPETEEKKTAKWRRICEEACKQCGRAWVPSVDRVWSISEAVSSLGEIENKIVCTPSCRGLPFRDVKDNTSGAAAVMIGPEGDFTERELDIVCEKGWIPVNMGKDILRSETAAVVALAIVRYKFGY